MPCHWAGQKAPLSVLLCSPTSFVDLRLPKMQGSSGESQVKMYAVLPSPLFREVYCLSWAQPRAWVNERCDIVQSLRRSRMKQLHNFLLLGIEPQNRKGSCCNKQLNRTAVAMTMLITACLAGCAVSHQVPYGLQTSGQHHCLPYTRSTI